VRALSGRVLVADELAIAGIAILAKHCDVDIRTGLTRSELLAVIGGYDAVIVRSSTMIDADVVDAGCNLKVIARVGTGLDNIDVEAATAHGVLVCNAPQSNAVSAAEHTIALLLALLRSIVQADRSLRAGQWARSAFHSTELYGKTLGILGLGRIGKLVAQRCNAFGMKLAAYDKYYSFEQHDDIDIEMLPTVRSLCEVADILTIHLPKTPETVGIVGEAELMCMKHTAYLVNTARGGIVDENALYTALTQGWIAGAALDVFTIEPMTDSPLLTLDNVVVTPHLGASTAEAQERAGISAAGAVVAALRGHFVQSAVNLKASERCGVLMKDNTANAPSVQHGAA
jgi:D-3-phosphoglycerate dehydrogenase / 2-oxoglutarate reductase